MLTSLLDDGIVNHQRQLSLRPLRPTRLALLSAGTAALVLLAGCGSAATPAAQGPGGAVGVSAAATPADAILQQLGLPGKDAKQVVEALDQKTGERDRDVLASVRYDTLVLKEGGREASLPIPGGKFYLSVAPYVEQTHDCYFHSLTTCKGELAQKTVNVTIKDSTGKAIVDGPATTYANGFVGFWLPRDISGTITVSYDGRSATSQISTTKDAPTCLTTLKLV
jgi:hypothetical protein